MTDESPQVSKRKRTRAALAHGWRYLVALDREWQEQRRTAPFPLVRWAISIGLLISTLPGASAIGPWWHEHSVIIIFAGVLAVGLDITSIEFGGLKMEMLREQRADMRALDAKVTQLQVLQASSNSQSKVELTQIFQEAENAARVIGGTKAGEEAPRVSAKDVNWSALTNPRARVFVPPPPSPAHGDASTVRK